MVGLICKLSFGWKSLFVNICSMTTVVHHGTSSLIRSVKYWTLEFILATCVFWWIFKLFFRTQISKFCEYFFHYVWEGNGWKASKYSADTRAREWCFIYYASLISFSLRKQNNSSCCFVKSIWKLLRKRLHWFEYEENI